MPVTLSVHTASFFPRNVRSDYLPGVQLDPLSLRKSRRSNTLFRMSRMSSKSMYRRLPCASHASSFADKCLGWPCSCHGCLLVPEELPSERPFQPERARTSDCLAPTNTLELCPRHYFFFLELRSACESPRPPKLQPRYLSFIFFLGGVSSP